MAAQSILTTAPVYPLFGIAEPVSALSHLIAAVIFVALGARLIRRQPEEAGARRRGIEIYSWSIVLLLLVSGLYHFFPPDSAVRGILRRLDHATIFILIASTFTPIHLILFERSWQWGMLSVVWSIALFGSALSLAFLNSIPEAVSLGLYLGLGWIGSISAVVLLSRFGLRFVLPLVLGALAYTFGALGDFMHYPVIISGVIGPHEVFHFAVIAGIAFHWLFIQSFADLALARCHETRAYLLLPR